MSMQELLQSNKGFASLPWKKISHVWHCTPLDIGRLEVEYYGVLSASGSIFLGDAFEKHQSSLSCFLHFQSKVGFLRICFN